MKRFAAILFCVLLVWMQTAPAPAPASPVCVKPAMGNCADCCGRMNCCAAKPPTDPQPTPAAPAQTGAQNQISLLAPGVAAWTLPQSLARAIISSSASPSLAMAAPLYAQNCSLLL